MNQRRKVWAALIQDRSGTEIVEAAMTLPLLFMFLVGILWFGLAFFIYGTLAQGTRLAAEAAAAPTCTTCAAGGTPAVAAQTAMYNTLAAAHLNKANLVPNTKWTAPTLCSCGTASITACSTPLACSAGAPDLCVQVNVQLSYPSQGGAGTCGTSVSARYKNPFHLSIPLTDLDLGNVLLPGQAQMREENQ